MSDWYRTSALHVEVGESVDRSTIRLSGDLDMASAEELQAVISRLHGSDPMEIVFDLRGLTFLDSRGLAVLIEAHFAGRDGHAPVRFIRGNRTIHRVFAITGMERQVTWAESD